MKFWAVHKKDWHWNFYSNSSKENCFLVPQHKHIFGFVLIWMDKILEKLNWSYFLYYIPFFYSQLQPNKVRIFCSWSRRKNQSVWSGTFGNLFFCWESTKSCWERAKSIYQNHHKTIQQEPIGTHIQILFSYCRKHRRKYKW